MNINKILQIAGINKQLIKEAKWISQLELDDAPPISNEQEEQNKTNNFVEALSALGFDSDLLPKFRKYVILAKLKNWNQFSRDEKIEIAQRIDPEYLPQIMKDEHWYVRRIVAQRIDPKYLPEMMKDDYWDVIYVVARRIDPEYLPQMRNNKFLSIRKIVAERIDPEYLPQMMNDPDDNVKRIVNERMAQLGMA